MSDMVKAELVLSVAATLNNNKSADMAATLLVALWRLHKDTVKEGFGIDNLTTIVSDGLREIDQNYAASLN